MGKPVSKDCFGSRRSARQKKGASTWLFRNSRTTASFTSCALTAYSDSCRCCFPLGSTNVKVRPVASSSSTVLSEKLALMRPSCATTARRSDGCGAWGCILLSCGGSACQSPRSQSLRVILQVTPSLCDGSGRQARCASIMGPCAARRRQSHG